MVITVVFAQPLAADIMEVRVTAADKSEMVVWKFKPQHPIAGQDETEILKFPFY